VDFFSVSTFYVQERKIESFIWSRPRWLKINFRKILDSAESQQAYLLSSRQYRFGTTLGH
jgi:hypothetical protein